MLFELKQEASKQSQHKKENKGKTPVRLVRRGNSVSIAVKGSAENQILVGQDQDESEQKANGKRGGEALQNECAKDGKCQVHHARPHCRNH